MAFYFLPLVFNVLKGRLGKSAIERSCSQAGADAGMSLNCCISLELDFFEVPFKQALVFWNGHGGAVHGWLCAFASPGSKP